MIDLKPYKDAVEARQDAVTEVAAEIDALMQDGKLEEALALQPKLDKAEADKQEAEKLYNSMAKVAERGSDPARNFVPVNTESDHQLEDEKPDEKVKTRAQFEELPARERLDFVKSGGTIAPDEDHN